MDLKSGELFWPRIAPAARVDRYPPIDGDQRCDVAVIGGGVTGALAALHLAQAGASVVVLDRRAIGGGSTPASTGLLQYEIDTPLYKLIDLVGAEPARRAYRLCVECLPDFRALVSNLDDDCGLTDRPSLYLGCEPDDLDELRRERDARRAIGIDVELLGADELRRTFGIDRPAALWSRAAMEVDPYRLTMSLVRGAAAHGARAFADTTVTKYDADGSSVTLMTGRGPVVRASHVVFATGYETPEFLDQSICRLRSTYAIVSEPLEKLGAAWRERCLIWESGDPYFYARTTADDRVMLGGEDEDTADPRARDALIDRTSRTLADKFHTLLPALPRIAPQFRWAGTFAQTKDGLPYIGTADQFPRGYFALGYGGNGITFSFIAARIIRDLFTGRGSEDAELFRFGR
jgi:glycine/D-amino acid oxidase-like deaminating enzyme